jgi:hypothetical protein
MLRREIANRLAEWVGDDVVNVIDAGTGWPSHLRIRTPSDWVNAAAYLGPIGLSHRGRDDVERRFQNPGGNRPIVDVPGEVPLLIGLYESDGTRLLVGMEVQKRLARSTRQSLFMPMHLLRSADAWGWAEHFSDAGERLVALTPRLLPIYAEIHHSRVDISPDQIERLLAASGVVDGEVGTEPIERAIASVNRLVRDAVFSRAVREAYGGRCAMCGLDFTLVEGAHIYPVAAPGCEDEVWNGLALCRNHHAAFDSFFIHVHPASGRVRLHPELVAGRTLGSGCKAFVDATFPELVTPKSKALRPRSDMFERRYEFFKPKYSWV